MNKKYTHTSISLLIGLLIFNIFSSCMHRRQTLGPDKADGYSITMPSSSSNSSSTLKLNTMDKSWSSRFSTIACTFLTGCIGSTIATAGLWGLIWFLGWTYDNLSNTLKTPDLNINNQICTIPDGQMDGFPCINECPYPTKLYKLTTGPI